jgi:predicted TPR repeat methyltransferase
MTLFPHEISLLNERSPFEKAFALHAAGLHGEAESAYRHILSLDPQHLDAQHHLGILLHQRGQSQDGIALILRGLEAEPGHAARYNDLGNILTQTGDLAQAASAFRLSLDFNDADANVWNNLGSVWHRQNNIVEAESAYRQALHYAADFVPALSNLARLLSETGRDEESSLLSCRAFVQPPFSEKPLKLLGIAYYRLGRLAEAAECYRAWLQAEPGHPIAQHHLAACTREQVPARAADDFITALFDEMAESFDEKLVGSLAYQGPQIIAGLLEARLDPHPTLDVLDGGCGTGLCASVLAPYARHLIGVDLSAAMLAKAQERQLYTELVEAELTSYLRERPNTFDLIVLADMLIYFGDLAVVFPAAKQALRPNGWLAFTVECATDPGVQEPYRLDPSGRFSHSTDYVRQTLEAAGLSALDIQEVALRNEFCKPVRGMAVLARC